MNFTRYIFFQNCILTESFILNRHYLHPSFQNPQLHSTHNKISLSTRNTTFITESVTSLRASFTQFGIEPYTVRSPASTDSEMFGVSCRNKIVRTGPRVFSTFLTVQVEQKAFAGTVVFVDGVWFYWPG